MFLPSIYGKDLWDTFWDTSFGEARPGGMMRTDIRETENHLELEIDLPGMGKEDVHAVLKDGYLTVTAQTKRGDDQENAQGKYLRRERYSGTFSRSFYIGSSVTEEEIRGRFENGTLILQIPKKDNRNTVETKKYIAIE